MERGLLTKVSKDFFTTIDGELSLAKGDYFLIYDVIDKHWYYGESRDKRGKFPSNHVHKVDIPDIKETEDLFIAIATFRGEQEGDLSFTEGEFVVGTHQVETNWYAGYIDSRQGIFPLSYVWRLDKSILKKPSSKKWVKRRARVKTSLKAQLEEELDLREGEVVTVLEILEDGWVRGVSQDGKEGTFPEAFISYTENPEMEERNNSCDRTRGSSNQSRAGTLSNSVAEGAPIYKDFGEALPSINLEEPAPDYYDLFPEAAASRTDNRPTSVTRSFDESLESPDNNLNPLGVQPYAITLYPFNAQFPNELSFAQGEVVHLVKHLDSEWAEGTIDDARGYFPISYVNIIVDCNEINAKDETSQSSQEDDSPSQDQLEIGASVKVDYTFDAQMDGDLSVAEGDIVVVDEMANEDWVSVRNSRGEIGLCPRAYLNSEIQVKPEKGFDLLEDFVVIRKEERSTDEESDEERPKRLSEPHRPAPPAPAPGRLPLSKQSITEKNLTTENRNDTTCSSETSPSDSEIEKRFEKRQNVISELVITEKSHLRDLKVTYETFNLHNPCLLESRGIDVGTLFGNMLEIIHVGEDLLDLVLGSMKGIDENSQTIAPCFLQMADKLRSAYCKYCSNHHAALILYEKYKDNPEIKSIFDNGIETLKRQGVHCFDMSSILIKPVQRILKYPLMLHELVKCTEENHPDKKGVEKALEVMTAVASSINEFKRRKDLVSKYLEEDNTLMRKMSKLTMHSVAKKSSRLSAKLSASLGLTNLSVDPVFEKLERHFKSLTKCTWQLAKDVEQCIGLLNDEAICGEVLADLLMQYYSGTPDKEIKRYREIRTAIRSAYLQNLKSCMKERVTDPINFLMTLLGGPDVLITKRYDKLLDYDNAISKSEKNKESKIAQDELIVAKTNFEALNQQLLEELPILINAATSILTNCVNAFTELRKMLSGKIMKFYLEISTSATLASSQDIAESFVVYHNLVWNQISRHTFTGETEQTPDRRINSCRQDERQKLTLRSRYQPEQLYMTKENVTSSSSLDLSAPAGTLLAVIKMQDPMGDASRWFVDNGSAQGFMPRKSLQRVSPSKDLSRWSVDVVDGVDDTQDLMLLDSPEKQVPRSSSVNSQTNWYTNIDSPTNESTNSEGFNQPQRYANVQPEFFYAAYDFQTSKTGTLPVIKGQALMLVRRSDEQGNEAWWLMEDRSGNQGYVPCNYLEPVETNPE